ncbi:hypothetical protein GCM10023333_05830 [Ferrimonas pelagia]|uniref:HTH-type transcriptional regulator AraC-type N-terminal domain-containing protein n=2 Tax=Ferrimonas pelagia TaxID=1177826 RepID=A0ABP9EDJ0_9GAMM
MLGLAVITAETLGESLQRTVDFNRLFTNSLIAELIDEGETVCYQLVRRPGYAIHSPIAIEQNLMVVHRFLTWLAQTRLPLLDVNLDYPASRRDQEYLQMFFDVPQHFNQASNCLRFHKDGLNLPNRRQPTDLERFTQRAPADLFNPLKQTPSLYQQTRAWLELWSPMAKAAPASMSPLRTSACPNKPFGANSNRVARPIRS